MEELLVIDKLRKSFPGVVAVADVSFSLGRGEILALIGENGAGKSTLSQVLGGALRPDSGRIVLEGREVSYASPLEAIHGGIRMMFQELSLVGSLSIAENIFANRQPIGPLHFIRWRQLHRETAEFLQSFRSSLDPKGLVKRLVKGEQQILEFLKAISTAPKVLILDEPTTSLTETETAYLMDNIRTLRAQGMSFIYITHKLSEVFKISNRVIVMRDGHYVGSRETSQCTERELVAMMVGREIANATSRPLVRAVEECLRVEVFSRRGAFSEVGFSARKGEILGLTGAHKVNNCIGQALLAKRMGKPRVIAETGAGQHGVATATVAARYGMECVVYMGSEDVRRQASNVYRMKLLGATVVPVTSGSRTLKDALNEAMRDWVTNIENTFYIIGTVAGPDPYPRMVRDFQTVIGNECLTQMPEAIGRQPDYVVAAVGGGSNAMGIFHPYIPYENVRLIGVEAAGEGMDSGKHAASLAAGQVGVLHGNRTYVMQDADGQVQETHSVSAGLDYPGVGPEHAWLKDTGRAEYAGITDDEALKAFHDCCRIEGIMPALESSHAIAQAVKMAATLPRDAVILVNLSGRGDKDMHTVAERAGIEL